MLRKLGLFGVASGAGLFLHDRYSQQTPTTVLLPKESGQSFRCTPGWLSHVLQKPVSQVDFKDLQGGISGPQLTRLQLEGDPSNTLMAKYASVPDLPPADFLQRLITVAMGMSVEKSICKKEPFFYTHLRPVLDSTIGSPDPLWIGTDDWGCRTPLFYLLFDFPSQTKAVMLLEDLSKHRHYGAGNFVSQDDAQIIVKDMARFHSVFFNRVPEVEKIIDNTKTDLNPFALRFFFGLGWATWMIGRAMKEPTIKAVMEKWKDDSLLGPIFANNGDQFLKLPAIYPQKLYPWNCEKEDLRPMPNLFKYKTFVHGDFHSGNLFISTQETNDDTPRTKMVDWQVYGVTHPSSELCYFLNSSVAFDPEFDQKLISLYHQELSKSLGDRLPQDYTLDVLKKEVDLRNLSLLSAWCSMMNLDSPDSRAAREAGNPKLVDLREVQVRSLPDIVQRFTHSLAREEATTSQE